jgi:hypothetical protein
MVCALCLQERPLSESHLIPAAAHRLLKERNELIVVASDKTFHSSKEIKERLLCDDCERLLNRHESYFLKLALQPDGTFPLRNMLEHAPTLMRDDDVLVRDTTTLDLDVERLSYFVLSVFWRGSVGNWNYENKRAISNNLGDKYNEIFRRYLKDVLPFPKEVRLLFLISNKLLPNKFMHIPVSWREEGFHMHRFTVPGFQFILMVGGVHDSSSKEACFYHSSSHPIYQTSWVDYLQDRDALRLIAGSSPSRRLQKGR